MDSAADVRELYGAAGTLLLELGADPNVLDDGGANALHHAAAAGSLEVASALLAAGADRDAGRSPCGPRPSCGRGTSSTSPSCACCSRTVWA
ncbi:ankyrin repeat domain-containing protein [Tenggerimyces flavus]|uniref:Ankyrin repeat domain-containing protein n=1 Tax=Tenggerimyces flavus TaxID=1708749 RepID=A0ABV7YJN9_9ACTN|nr:ankyrin repeat domain-containing protein [Tenggerimyces flavus]MBM7784083.1 ankyrin repeat protein [Tenggerimyces flavus]